MSSFDQEKVKAAAEKLKLLLPKVRTEEKKLRDQRLFSKFQPIFSVNHIASLSAEEFSRFTSFKENEHWTGIHRQNGMILKDINLLRKVLTTLLDESRPIAERIDEFRPRTKGKTIKGFGSAVYTAILFTMYPEKYPVRNRKTVTCLKDFGLFERASVMSYGENYQHVYDVSHALCEAVGCTISELDGLYHFYLEDQDADNELPRVFKLSPGAVGSEWETMRTASVAAIGWNVSGSIQDADIKQAALKAINAGESGDTSYLEGQFGMIRDELENGDMVLYYAKGKIIGLATVTGDYQFNPSTKHGHQRPVKFLEPFVAVSITDDEEMRDFFFDNVTMKELEDEDFKEKVFGRIAKHNKNFSNIESNLPSANPIKKEEQIASFNGFTKEAFELLMTYRKSPTRETYQKSKLKYESLLRDPARALFQNLAPGVSAVLGDSIETRSGILSVIQKNDYGKGGIHDHYWGAFFPSESKRIEAAQLYVIFYSDKMKFGFGFGHKSEEYKQRLINHLENGQWLDEDYFQRLKDAGISLRIWNWKEKMDSFPNNMDVKTIKAACHTPFMAPNFDFSLSPDEVESMGEKLTEKISETFQLLLPLYILATNDNPEILLEKVQGVPGDEVVDLDIPPVSYTWTDFCADQNWHSTNPVAAQLHQMLGTPEQLKADPKQIIFFGPPGTGKSRAAHNLARALTKSIKHVRKVQFHQSYGYEQFIEGIRPHVVAGQMTYLIKKGTFVEFCDQARKAPGEQFVMIIDEINRGNVSKIFGELMYLLEYRNEGLPLLYSQEPFSIPSNVTLIATMNSADRSLALVDYALRRRFQFVEFGYQAEVLSSHYRSVNATELKACLNFIDLINAKIGDPRLQIGHSYFLFKDSRTLSKKTLSEVWTSQIYPLLQEYFLSSASRLEEFSFTELWKEANEAIVSAGEAA